MAAIEKEQKEQRDMVNSLMMMDKKSEYLIASAKEELRHSM